METNVCKVLGENIKKIRKIRGITQNELAEMLSLEVKSLSLIETGKGFISAKTLEKLIKILKISPAELFATSDQNECNKIYSEIVSDLDIIKEDAKKLNTVSLVLKSLL